MHNAANQNGQPGNAMQHQNHGCEQGIAHQCGVFITREHQGNDETRFNDCDGKRQDQAAKGFTHMQRHNFCMMDCCNNIAEQRGKHRNGNQPQRHLANQKPCGNASRRRQNEERRNAILCG